MVLLSKAIFVEDFQENIPGQPSKRNHSYKNLKHPWLIWHLGHLIPCPQQQQKKYKQKNNMTPQYQISKNHTYQPLDHTPPNPWKKKHLWDSLGSPYGEVPRPRRLVDSGFWIWIFHCKGSIIRHRKTARCKILRYIYIYGRSREVETYIKRNFWVQVCNRNYKKVKKNYWKQTNLILGWKPSPPSVYPRFKMDTILDPFWNAKSQWHIQVRRCTSIPYELAADHIEYIRNCLKQNTMVSLSRSKTGSGQQYIREYQRHIPKLWNLPHLAVSIAFWNHCEYPVHQYYCLCFFHVSPPEPIEPRNSFLLFHRIILVV